MLTCNGAGLLLSESWAGGNRATYSYVANTPLVSQIGVTNNGTGCMTTTKQYDAQGRRIRKQVRDNPTFDGNLIVDQRFVYDGWNLVAVLAPDASL